MTATWQIEVPLLGLVCHKAVILARMEFSDCLEEGQCMVAWASKIQLDHFGENSLQKYVFPGIAKYDAHLPALANPFYTLDF